jgi:hypothetical protein
MLLPIKWKLIWLALKVSLIELYYDANNWLNIHLIVYFRLKKNLLMLRCIKVLYWIIFET